MAKVTLAQRVEIAKDVLKQIKVGSISVHTGSYITLPGDEYAILVPKKYKNASKIDVQDLIASGKLKHCEVCARGAMILSKARLYDKCSLPIDDEGYIDGEDISYTLGEDMSLSAFGDFGQELEAAFEGWSGPGCNDDYEPEGEGDFTTYHKWMEVYPVSEERLKALMENVIRNNGKFLVSDIPIPVQQTPKKKAKKKVAKK